MAGPEDELAKSSPYWGVISEGARLHETTAELWDRIRAEAERTGLPIPSEGATFINAARSAFGSVTTAAENLARAPDTYAIEGRFLARAPYSPTPGGPPGVRRFDVRVPYQAVSNGQPVSDWVTLRYTGGLPGTVGELRADASIITRGLVEGYGAALVDIGDPEIVEL